MNASRLIRTLLLGVSLLVSAPLLAQDMGDDDTSVPDPTAEIRDMDKNIADDVRSMDQMATPSSPLAPPDASITTTSVQQSGNAGSMTGILSSTGSSHSESRSTTTSTSVSVGIGPGDDDHQHWGGLPAPGNGDIVGNWTLGEENGSHCSIQLRSTPYQGGYSAFSQAGCPRDLVNVNRWVIIGNQLQLTDSNNQVLGRFWHAGNGRWGGRRESDGAHLYLNR